MTRHLLDEVLEAKQQREDERRMPVIAERVKRGAALLDEKRPGWWRDIDLETLDIESPCNCILGQVTGSRDHAGYSAALRSVGLSGMGDVAYGFEADDDAEWLAEEYARLEAAWRDLILARRAERVPA